MNVSSQKNLKDNRYPMSGNLTKVNCYLIKLNKQRNNDKAKSENLFKDKILNWKIMFKTIPRISLVTMHLEYVARGKRLWYLTQWADYEKKFQSCIF